MKAIKRTFTLNPALGITLHVYTLNKDGDIYFKLEDIKPLIKDDPDYELYDRTKIYIKVAAVMSILSGINIYKCTLDNGLYTIKMYIDENKSSYLEEIGKVLNLFNIQPFYTLHVEDPEVIIVEKDLRMIF